MEEGKEQEYIAETIEQKCAEAFMDGYRYAIRLLQDALAKIEKSE